MKISMLGAGSGFVMNVANELTEHELFNGTEFALMDISAERLAAAKAAVSEIVDASNINIKITATQVLAEALTGCDYVIASCEQDRYANWVKDLTIPASLGVHQVKGENGGPGGMIHAMRNIYMFQEIIEGMKKYCPNAWLMNFTNPMSILCTYFKNYSPIKSLGFCHQVHGSFGVIAEMLGMSPDELEIISAGNNHLNWLFDIRRKNSRESCMEEFLQLVKDSKYWQQRYPNVPPQNFTLEVLNTFNMYPIGYDDHIIEYMPFFWEEHEWAEKGCESLAGHYVKLAADDMHTLETQRLLGKDYDKPPFPVNPDHPYYAEKPCQVITALETNTPTYFDAINIPNNGAITNLPNDIILDVPGIAIGGEVRSIHVGELPPGPLEICRRQSVLHEMIAQATHEGDESLAIQALCLDPYVNSITQAKNIWQAFKIEYIDYLPGFK
jgi:alpha-galactosidase/6-phospho-beta-glucosidase family protein